MTTDAVAMDPELAKRVLTALRAQDEPAGEDAGELRRPGGGRAAALGGGAAESEGDRPGGRRGCPGAGGRGTGNGCGSGGGVPRHDRTQGAGGCDVRPGPP